MIRRFVVLLILSALVTAIHPTILFAQDAATVQCGSIVESELLEDGTDGQLYSIEMAAGDTLNITVEVLGQTLNIMFIVLSPTNEVLQLINSENYHNGPNSGYITYRYMNDYIDGLPEDGSTPVLSGRGTYTIVVQGVDSNDIGVYTLKIGCTLRDGTLVLPGELPPQSFVSDGGSSVVQLPIPFSGVGFPGLAPVDFSTVARIPISVGVGAITPVGGEVIGYTLDANAGDVLDLTFTRLSGNLNLGLAVLSPDNTVVFQASLVTSSTLNTRFTLPSAGQYMVGIFRIDLLPPNVPEATAFQVQGILNP